jgi:hypothetical protein
VAVADADKKYEKRMTVPTRWHLNPMESTNKHTRIANNFLKTNIIYL